MKVIFIKCPQIRLTNFAQSIVIIAWYIFMYYLKLIGRFFLIFVTMEPYSFWTSYWFKKVVFWTFSKLFWSGFGSI